MDDLLMRLMLAKILADAADSDVAPDNYNTLPNDPQAWQQKRDDCKKQNQVICIEFLDEEMGKYRTATERLARAFQQVPFFRVVIDQANQSELEVCKDVGGIQQLPAIVVIYFGKKEDGQEQKYAVKYQGLKEIQDGLRSDSLKRNIQDLVSRRNELKRAEQLRARMKEEEEARKKERSMDDFMMRLMLAKILADAADSDVAPDNYNTLPNDPRAWQQKRDDCKKQNQVICVEFLDEKMSRYKTATEGLAREFQQVPFFRVVVDQTAADKFESEVCKDIGGIQQLPALVLLFFGKKEDGQEQKYVVKFQGLKEIQDGLNRGSLKTRIRELLSRRDELKQADQRRADYAKKMREEEEARKTSPVKSWKHKTQLSHTFKPSATSQDDEEEMEMEFSKSMNPSNLSKWLLKDAGRHYQDDIVKLKDGKIGGREFLQLPSDTEVLRDLHVSPGFRAYLRARVKKLKGVDETDISDTPELKFSKALTPNELAAWLLQELGVEYTDDITKVKDCKINGILFLQNQSLASDLGLSYGFQLHSRELLQKLKEKDVHQSTSKTDSKHFTITQQPRDQIKHIHQGTMLTVRVDRDHPALKYQWIKEHIFLSEDDLKDCSGVTSNTLRFTSLSTQHRGNYMCQVSIGTRMIASREAKVEVLTSMKLNEFFKENAECQDGLVIISDSLKEGFHSHLHRFGFKCVEDIDKALENIESHAIVSYVDAIIDFETQEVETKLDRIGDPKECINSKAEDRVEQYQKSVKYIVGSENCQTKVRGWSVSGGLAGTYQGVGANVGVEYGRQKSSTKTSMECTEREETFVDSILVPGESRVKVTVEKRLDTCVCEVRDILVTFHRRFSRLKCKYERANEKGRRNREFKLEDVFMSQRDHANKDGLTIKLNGKCQWSETTVYLHRSEPVPVKPLRDWC